MISILGEGYKKLAYKVMFMGHHQMNFGRIWYFDSHGDAQSEIDRLPQAWQPHIRIDVEWIPL